MSVPSVLPPTSPNTIFRTRLLGIACCGTATVLGLVAAGVGEVTVLNTVRVWLSITGAIAGGAALSLLPLDAKSWLIAAATMFLAAFGFPPHWDSFRFLATVLACVSLIGAVLMFLPVGIRASVGAVYLIFHFGGILTATTWPTPTPWITEQLANHVYQPYLKFLYLLNAYHFYSPDPGPASHLYFLVKYQSTEIDPATGKPTESFEWVTLPTRPEQIKDPLALTYYRRLAISEQCAMATPDAFTPSTFEKSEAYQRRMEVHNGLRPGYPKIPIAPPETEPWGVQYKVPSPRITSYILPSYIRHIATHHKSADRTPVLIRAYRLEHRITHPALLVEGLDPYHPTTYRPYFLGDYDANGDLVDPQDPMLYWLVPIVNKPGGAAPGDPRKRDYEDYLEKHAGAVLEWRRP
jgi:hypothetical protein